MTTIMLTEDDLTTILDLLDDVPHKWEEIATYLKLRPGTIAVIKESGDARKKLLGVIRRWLTITKPPPTVTALVEALRKPFIGEEKVAQDIEKHFYLSSPTGRLLSRTGECPI